MAIRDNFYWPNMKHEIEDYARTCDVCQKNKPDNQKKGGLLHPLPVPSKAWEHIAMDFVTKLPRTARGYSAIMVVVDRLSKQVHLIPTKDESTAAQTAQVFLDRIYSQHGMPLSIVSDRDSKFTAHFWEKLMELLGTDLKMSSARHPETDGQSERTIRTITQYLRSFVKYNFKDWDLWLPMAEFAYNSAIHSATGMSPFQVVLGRQPLTPLALIKARIESGDERVDQLLEKHQQVRKVCWRILESVGLGPFANREDVVTHEEMKAADSLQENQEKMKERVDQNRREVSFEEGERVLISTKDFDRNQYSSRKCRKLGPKFIGPYKIRRNLGNDAYVLDLPGALDLHPTFHTSQLKKYAVSLQYPGHSTKPAITDHTKGHKNEKIVEVVDQRTRNGTREYRVKWEGGEEGWVPARNLENAHEEILGYERTQTNAQKKPEEEEETAEEEEAEEEEELQDQRTKSKKTTLQRELKALASLEGTEGK